MGGMPPVPPVPVVVDVVLPPVPLVSPPLPEEEALGSRVQPKRITLSQSSAERNTQPVEA
jgi:hypothetical protein